MEIHNPDILMHISEQLFPVKQSLPVSQQLFPVKQFLPVSEQSLPANNGVQHPSLQKHTPSQSDDRCAFPIQLQGGVIDIKNL